MTNENQDATRDGDAAPRPTFIDSDVRARLVDVARKAGLDADEFVEKLLLRLAKTGVEFERGVPVFPRRPSARVLTVEDVDRLASE